MYTDLEQRAQRELQRWLVVANDLLAEHGARLMACPELAFDLRGRGAGLAVYPRRRRKAEPGRIRLNGDLLAEHPCEMIEETLPHELAHIVAHHLFGPRIKPHGPEWRSVMAAFGKNPEVSHRMAAEPTRRLRRFHYRCGCPQGVELTSIRHKRAQRGAGYVCRRCGERLHWSGSEVAQEQIA